MLLSFPILWIKAIFGRKKAEAQLACPPQNRTCGGADCASAGKNQ